MTTTQNTEVPTTGTVFVGRCQICKAKYSYVETAPNASANYMPNAPYCACRATTTCAMSWCDPEPHTHEATFIKFKPVNATVTEKTCAASCWDAGSPNCACSCGGRNHGASIRLARSAA